MPKINYLKIQHFKTFGDEVVINLEDNPTVLIGANNSGKTTTIQALALWNWAVRVWFEKKRYTKSKAERNKGVALNRLEIAQVPIKEARYFWNNAKVRQNSTDNISLIIKVGLFYQNQVTELGMIFKYHSPDLIYCQPTENSFTIDGLLEFANNLKINLLYPMSGIGDKEYVFQEDAIRTQIGIGQTANVLRNICYHLYEKNKNGWIELTKLMKTLFSVELKNPFVRATGVIELLYNYSTRKKTDYDLDITLAGRGQQQMLLVLSYLLANQNSVLMIDEPDAHLEILRQTHIFSVLKEVAAKYNCQIIIVTHSEVVLNEANTVIFLADGKAQEISEKKDHKFIKDALRTYGIEHYYKAKIHPRILYIESSTDKEMLKAFAQKFEHPALNIFNEMLHFYYTKNEVSEDDLENELNRKSGFYQAHKQHFQAIKSVVPELIGIGIFDGDNKVRQDELKGDLIILYWKRYELENYFITPKVILSFAEQEYKIQGLDGIFLSEKMKKLEILIHNELIESVIQDKTILGLYKKASQEEREALFVSQTENKKMSSILETTLEIFAKQEGERILLTKGNFYKLIEFLDKLPKEVEEKLDYLKKYLEF